MVRFKLSEQFARKVNKLFREQKIKILKLLPYATVKHIGSTSVRGALTKGDLDVLVTVPERKFKEAVSELKKVYRVNQSKNWEENYASFKNAKLNFGLQLVTPGDKLGFMKHLTSLKNRKFLEKYNTLKRAYHGRSMNEYRKAKDKFFRNI